MAGQQEHLLQRLTFQELLTRILLEEGFMLDRSAKIIEHDVEDRFNLIFGVSRVVSKICILDQSINVNSFIKRAHRMTYPFASVEYQTR